MCCVFGLVPTMRDFGHVTTWVLVVWGLCWLFKGDLPSVSLTSPSALIVCKGIMQDGDLRMHPLTFNVGNPIILLPMSSIRGMLDHSGWQPRSKSATTMIKFLHDLCLEIQNKRQHNCQSKSRDCTTQHLEWLTMPIPPHWIARACKDQQYKPQNHESTRKEMLGDQPKVFGKSFGSSSNWLMKGNWKDPPWIRQQMT